MKRPGLSRLCLVFTVVTIATSFLSACAGYKRLTPGEARNVNTVCVTDTLGTDINYVHLGITIFGNYKYAIENEDIVPQFRQSVEDELTDRGYSLASSASDCDYELALSRITSYNYPSGKGVDGAGFFITAYGGGVQVQITIAGTLKYPLSGEQRNTTGSVVKVKTEIQKPAKTWTDYSKQEQQYLLGVLREGFKTVPAELLDKLDLAAK